METKTLRERCQEVMTKHLESVGYPNMSRRAVLDELRTMWNKLDVAGLMPELKAQGYHFFRFVQTANRKAQEAALIEFAKRMGRK